VDDGARAKLEQDVKSLCEQGAFDQATTQALRGYGPEIYGWIAATHRSEQEANDVFSEFAEGLWRNLPKFGWQGSLRTWAYAVARNSSLTYRRNAGRRARRGDRPGGESMLEDVAVAVRTETQIFLRTEKRSGLEALRDALDEDDRTLLILRVDRRLAWNEIAQVMAGDDASIDLTKEAARLRKRFQLVKEGLHEAARRAGLTSRDD